MPFKLTPGLIVVVVVIAILFFGLVGWAATSGGGSKPQAQKGTAVCTVNAEVGIFAINITNQNVPGGNTAKTAMNLPFSFNFTIGDTLQFTAIMLPEYKFINWEFPQNNTFIDYNPLTIKPAGNIVINAKLMVK